LGLRDSAAAEEEEEEEKEAEAEAEASAGFFKAAAKPRSEPSASGWKVL
jgi:hypothetical protein